MCVALYCCLSAVMSQCLALIHRFSTPRSTQVSTDMHTRCTAFMNSGPFKYSPATFTVVPRAGRRGCYGSWGVGALTYALMRLSNVCSGARSRGGGSPMAVVDDLAPGHGFDAAQRRLRPSATAGSGRRAVGAGRDAAEQGRDRRCAGTAAARRLLPPGAPERLRRDPRSLRARRAGRRRDGGRGTGPPRDAAPRSAARRICTP